MRSFTQFFCLIQVYLLINLLFLINVKAVCPNLCNGHGFCDSYSRCHCAKGYQGGDCSERKCPIGAAWSGYPTSTDIGHERIECSNRGICDRANGECTCMEGFEGSACEVLSCPNNCGGVGKCVSMSEHARIYRNDNSETKTYNTVWDSFKINGCVCDPGYSGYYCSLRVCPHGDDPLTSSQVNEVQLVKCSANGQGSFVLDFKGYPSASINWDANAADIKTALSAIPILNEVDVSFTDPTGYACQTIANIIKIEFKKDFGPQPPFKAIPDDVIVSAAQSVVIAGDGVTTFTDGVQEVVHLSVKGTKENDECSNRGLCTVTEGTCTCFSTNGDTYASSNGEGGVGLRGDCGFVSSGSVSTCPGEVQCNGNGVCATDGSFRCNCNNGWGGGDCSLRLCPKAPSWFDYPLNNDVAHTTLEYCSGKGLCDFSVGMCECQAGFFGQACEFMSCGGTPESPCFGHGQCKSLQELAPYTRINGELQDFTYGNDPNLATTWDATRIHHCVCDEGYHGYDCSLRSCPIGDDPGTWAQKTEQQIIKCIADSGTFSIAFRDERSEEIPFNASVANITTMLSKMKTINKPHIQILDINITYSNVSTPIDGPVCDPLGMHYLKIDFIRNHGDLPSLSTNSSLRLSSGSPVLRLYNETGAIFNNNTELVVRDGNTETDVCSNRGLCLTLTGECQCFSNFLGSDGAGNAGNIPDCGHHILSHLEYSVYDVPQ